jgi:hypothetical protein
MLRLTGTPELLFVEELLTGDELHPARNKRINPTQTKRRGLYILASWKRDLEAKCLLL